jgi:hypothetical protein
MRIVIETILHQAQRYNTVGDWWTDADGTSQIRVSDMQQPAAELLVAVHELIEMILCNGSGVEEDEVTKFDRNWKPCGNITEPGDDIAAPYYLEHQIATAVERLLAAQLGIPWPWYEQTVNSLGASGS